MTEERQPDDILKLIDTCQNVCTVIRGKFPETAETLKTQALHVLAVIEAQRAAEEKK